ncbi:hypothetical protein BGZ74_003743, partial [Mortierella antarctica]
KLNKMHRKKILEATRAILEDREPCADVLVKASEGSMRQEDNPNSTGDDGRVADQSICDLDDGADYFSDLGQPGSGDEDEDDRFGCTGSNVQSKEQQTNPHAGGLSSNIRFYWAQTRFGAHYGESFVEDPEEHRLRMDVVYEP